MFSQGHLIWIGISVLLIAGGLWACLRKKPPLRKVMTICMALGAGMVLLLYGLLPIIKKVNAYGRG